MIKRVVALLLCLASLSFCFVGCSHGENDKGAYIRMYLSQPVYDLDPLSAFDSKDTLQIVSLLFIGLFEADEDGKPQKALVDKYDYEEDKDQEKYTMLLTLKETNWSDGVPVSANDVQYAFSRLFKTDVSHPAVALLCNIKNAREIIAGNTSEDHLGISVIDNLTVEIEFEGPIDEEAFLLALCSPALYPLRENIVEVNADWAKKSSTIVCSGPFMVRSLKPDEKDGVIFERNSYYFRDRAKDDIDEYVTPYRIVMDWTTPAEEQLKLFNSKEAGGIYYFGHIPVAARNNDEFKKIIRKVDKTNAISTHTYYLNENVEIGGTKLFAEAKVRQALSLALNRKDIAEQMVFAKPATGIVPYAILNRPDRDAQFRKKGDNYLEKKADLDAAKALLSEAGINPASYSFSITVPSYNDEHKAIAEMAKTAWCELGFNVTIKELGATERKTIEVDNDGNEKTVMTDIWDDAYKAALKSGNFEVIALDLVATSPDAFSYLAPFATKFSGNAINMDITVNPNYDLTPHITGYQSEAFEALIEEAFSTDSNRVRAKKLHEAEKILMTDLPAIPVVFNQNTSLASGKLKKIESSYYTPAVFTKTKLSGYWKIALRDEFVKEEDAE